MNIEGNLINGIYNFCDGWCKRCLFTQRCHSYKIQAANGLNKPGDPNATLMQQLTEALTLTKQYLTKVQSVAAPEGLPASDAPLLEQQAVPKGPIEHPLAGMTQLYLTQTGNWLRNERGLLEQAGYQQLHEVKLGLRTEAEALVQLNALKDAWEMIKWYRTLIPIKSASALRLFNEPTADLQLADYYVGKAKLVLVSIDRSLLAWQTLMTYYPDKIDELLDMLALLSRISRELESYFPEAAPSDARRSINSGYFLTMVNSTRRFF